MTERTAGHSARGSPRRSALAASQAMSPCAPAARNSRSRSARQRDRIRPRHADGIKALRPRGREQRRLQRGRRSEIEIGVGRRRRQAGQRFVQQRAERRPRFDPRVPVLGGLVFVPRHIAQIIGGGQMRRRGQIGIGQIVAGEPVARADQPADIGQMVPDVALCRTQRFGVRRAAAAARPACSAYRPAPSPARRDTSSKNLSLNQLISRRTSMRAPRSAGNSRNSPSVSAAGLVEIFGDDAGARDRRARPLRPGPAWCPPD